MATSSYFLPAVFLNPVVVLHSLNTYFSYRFPPVFSISTSPHAIMEKFGPLPGSTPYFDIHANDNLCWAYTCLMVCAQVFAYANVGGNRIKKKNKLRKEGKDIKHSRWSETEESPKAQIVEIRDDKRKESLEMDEEIKRRCLDKGRVGGMDGANDDDMERPSPKPQPRKQIRMIRSHRNRNGTVQPIQNGHAALKPDGEVEDGSGVADFLDDVDERDGDIEAANMEEEDEEDEIEEGIVHGEDNEEEESDESASETSDDLMIL